MSTQPHTTTTIGLEQADNDRWAATQSDVDLTGYGDDPGAAVAHYDELVSETVYASSEDSA